MLTASITDERQLQQQNLVGTSCSALVQSLTGAWAEFLALLRQPTMLLLIDTIFCLAFDRSFFQTSIQLLYHTHRE